MPSAHNHVEVGPGGLGNLRRLAYFVAVVETGSFTAAAERLGITKACLLYTSPGAIPPARWTRS
ncbi:helix-turn-helix domain-containing protein [Xanthomonas campestris]|uniref:helix-turn-helix domain-containing protein n=1 Tax=Xanthomonas campestris TaxID=339 RepID=UPI001EE7D4E6|nr:LysR family transcriptional regulator [Xanthomonas campestris]